MERLFRIAESNVRRDWGETAFARLGEEIQKGLLAREVMALLVGQDESVPSDRVREMLAQMWDLLSDWEWRR